MAKPKGGTLTRLFEVSERERQEFYERIQKNLHTVDQAVLIEKGVPVSGILKTGIPEKGTPPLGTPEIGIPKKGAPVRKLRIRRALQVQDAHSLGEHLVLTTLWNEADVVEGEPYRRITIGYRTLSIMCGLTVNNCKANLKSLQSKLAIQLEVGYSATSGTTYRVFGFVEILRRRETAGMTHVLRNRGSLFVHPESGIPISGIGGVPVSGIPDYQTGIPETGETGIPGTGTHLRIRKEGESKKDMASVGVVSDVLRKHIHIDDDAVTQIVARCQDQDPAATSEEIAYFAELKLNQHCKNPSVQNLPGLLIRSVQDYFRLGSGELTTYRQAKARERAEQEKLARDLLDSDESTDQERKWATMVLPDAS